MREPVYICSKFFKIQTLAHDDLTYLFFSYCKDVESLSICKIHLAVYCAEAEISIFSRDTQNE